MTEKAKKYTVQGPKITIRPGLTEIAYPDGTLMDIRPAVIDIEIHYSAEKKHPDSEPSTGIYTKSLDKLVADYLSYKRYFEKNNGR